MQCNAKSPARRVRACGGMPWAWEPNCDEAADANAGDYYRTGAFRCGGSLASLAVPAGGRWYGWPVAYISKLPVQSPMYESLPKAVRTDFDRTKTTATSIGSKTRCHAGYEQ